jgi:hypothetical protein
MSPRRRHPIAALVLLAVFAACTPAVHAAPAPTPVRVGRQRPPKEPLPTMRFLRANREFFRSRLDLLVTRPIQVREGASAIDPRFLAYRDMVAAAGAAGDSLTLAADEDRRRTLFASVTELGGLEAQLDELDRVLAAQRVRLASLQQDFAGHQRTALAVVVSGWPKDGAPDSLALVLDDGTRLDVPLATGPRASLAAGGVLEVFHGLIEPREQSIAIAAIGRGAAADSGFVTLDPEHDRLTFLRLDLSNMTPGSAASSIAATSWVYDDLPDADRERSREP